MRGPEMVVAQQRRNEHTQSVRIKISPVAAREGEANSSEEKSIRNCSFWRDMCVTVNRS